MENQKPNLRFLKNEDFASTAIEMLQNPSRTIIETLIELLSNGKKDND